MRTRGAGCAGPATNLYTWATLHTEENDVFINAGPAAAFRAPGHPQGVFALEQTIDELAEKLNMEPLELRDKIDDNPVRQRRAPDYRRERHLEIAQPQAERGSWTHQAGCRTVAVGLVSPHQHGLRSGSQGAS